MPVIINIDSKNGAENCDKSRQETNISNLEQAEFMWKTIQSINEKKYPDYKNFKATSKAYHNLGKKFCDDLEKLAVKTIPSRITKNYIFFGLASPDSISWKEIKKMALLYSKADPWLQINFCTDSTKQSVDEKVQRMMLKKAKDLDKWRFKKCKPTSYLFEGKIHQGKIKKEFKRKSIDTFGEHKDGNKKIWIFQKYAKVPGGHQDNVNIETKHFLEDACKYINNDSVKHYFIAQLDGAFIESKLPELRKIYKNTKTKYVYAGNSENVIDWIGKIKGSKKV